MMRRLMSFYLGVFLSVGLVFAAETEIDVVGKQWLNPGLYTFTSRSIPDDATGIGLRIDRRDFTDPTGHVDFSIQVSFDGGASWEAFRGAATDGGVFTDRLGATITSTKYLVEIAPGVGRLVKGQIEITGDTSNVGVKVRLLH